MGYSFGLEHASLVGWLTRRDFPGPYSEFDGPWWWDYWHGPWHRHHRHFEPFSEREDDSSSRWRAPRADQELLRSFLQSLPESVVTSDGEDRQILRYVTRESEERLARYREREAAEFSPPRREDLPRRRVRPSPLPSNAVADVLAPLRRWFSLPFYFLHIGDRWLDRGTLQATPPFTLWLQCRSRFARIDDLLDPFPALSSVLAQRADFKGTLCWNWSGDSALLIEEKTPVEKLLGMVREEPRFLWRLIKDEARKTSLPPSFHILHMSDLHFGTDAARENLRYVERRVRTEIEKTRAEGGAVQPVITGDLMDTPDDRHLEEFEGFRDRVQSIAQTNVIVIPGNHDMKMKGFLGRQFETVAQLEWSSVIRSEVAKALFLCFDSSKDADLARGKITDDQFKDVATRLDGQADRAKIEGWIRIALVHHHPFSTEEDELDTIPMLRIREEKYLRMENGEQLVKWCARRNVPLILHGHKHKPRFIGRELEHEGGTRMVRAVGCGTSFGVEGKPLSYNWITWNPDSRSWTLSFFADPGDGSGFQAKRLALGNVAVDSDVAA